MITEAELLAKVPRGLYIDGAWVDAEGGATMTVSDPSTGAVLAEIGLEDIADDKVAGIPILARKQLMVATAMVNEPDILLLDEPVGGLTPPEIEEFIELMLRLKGQGLTLIFIEHVMHFLMAVAGRAMIMHQGKIIYDGAPQGLISDKTVTEVYLGSAGIAVPA